MPSTSSIDLSKTPVHLPASSKKDDAFKVLNWFKFDGESFGRYVGEICSEDDPGRLVMIETMVSDWPTWERHTKGDELVIVLSGSGTFYQKLGEEISSCPFQAGDTFVNPKGVWHTADVTEPMRAIYITPCPGTEHQPRD